MMCRQVMIEMLDKSILNIVHALCQQGHTFPTEQRLPLKLFTLNHELK
jgi:hypothetical protein